MCSLHGMFFTSHGLPNVRGKFVWSVGYQMLELHAVLTVIQVGSLESGLCANNVKNYVFLIGIPRRQLSLQKRMYCDYLQGPFVTKTNLLNFDAELPNEVLFEDWFLRVVEDGILIMSYPDAMYFTTDYYSYSKETDKNVWASLAKKRELNRVLLRKGLKHSFSCQDIGFRCNHAQSELFPVCCQEGSMPCLFSRTLVRCAILHSNSMVVPFWVA